MLIDTDLANVIQADRRAEAAEERKALGFIKGRRRGGQALLSKAGSLARLPAFLLFHLGWQTVRPR
jgi:hypothetical protein